MTRGTIQDTVAKLQECELTLANHARDIAATNEWKKAGYTSMTAYLTRELGIPLRIARRMMQDARLLYRTANEETRKKILEGTLPMDHARFIDTHTGTKEDFNEAAAAAAETNMDQQQIKDHLGATKPAAKPPRQRCRFHMKDGTLTLSATLVGVDAATTHAALLRAVRDGWRGKEEKRGHERRNADALVGLITRAGGKRKTQPTADVVIVVDGEPDALSEYRTTTGATLSAQEAMGLLGEQSRTWVVLRHPVTLMPLALGRTKRLASVYQRLVIMATQETCAIKHCTRPIHSCQIHHKHDWKDGGGTDIDNLIGVCARHHALMTGGYINGDPSTHYANDDAAPDRGEHP